MTRHIFAVVVLGLSLGGASAAAAAPEGQMTWAVHISLAPTRYDPAETSGIITPFVLRRGAPGATMVIRSPPRTSSSRSSATAGRRRSRSKTAWRRWRLRIPAAYLDKVSDEGFKKAPIGAGPYKFVAFTPGVELVLEAFEPYGGGRCRT